MVEPADLTEAEREAIHEVERGAEWIHRAHGLLVEFHHAVGHAMDHFESAAAALEADHPDLAARFEEEVLPAGLTEEDHLSYQLLAEFEEGFLDTVEAATGAAREELVDGERYVVEAARHEAEGVVGKGGKSGTATGGDGSSTDGTTSRGDES